MSGIPAEYLFLNWGYTLIKRLSEGGCAEELWKCIKYGKKNLEENAENLFQGWFQQFKICTIGWFLVPEIQISGTCVATIAGR